MTGFEQFIAAMAGRVAAHDAREAEKRDEAEAAKAKALADARAYMFALGTDASA
jgi:hypothetical protein